MLSHLHQTMGQIKSPGQSRQLDVILVVNTTEAVGMVQIYLRDPKSRRGGELIMLDAKGWDDLKAAIAETEAMIERLGSGKPIRLVMDGFRMG